MDDICALLERARTGDDAAWQLVVASFYDDLLRLARCATTAGGANTLNPTALVHECYLRLTQKGAAGILSREHFLALAGRAMRQILINHARDRMADKRGGGAPHTTLSHLDIAADTEAQDLLELEAALAVLAREDERLLQVIDCRIFGGMTEEETSAALDLSLRTTQRLWLQARTRLHTLFAEPDV